MNFDDLEVLDMSNFGETAFLNTRPWALTLLSIEITSEIPDRSFSWTIYETVEPNTVIKLNLKELTENQWSHEVWTPMYMGKGVDVYVEKIEDKKLDLFNRGAHFNEYAIDFMFPGGMEFKHVISRISDEAPRIASEAIITYIGVSGKPKRQIFSCVGLMREIIND